MSLGTCAGDYLCAFFFFFLPPTSGPQLQMLQNKASSESPICGVFKRGE